MLALVVWGSCTFGQWDTNSWPAYTHSRSGRVHAENCYSAVLERVVVAGYTNAVQEMVWWRSQRSNLQALKDAYKNAILYYTHPSNTIESQTGWLNGSTGEAARTTLASWSITNAVQYLKLPTNFFDYTPYRCLNGVGPYSNDPTVGRPHGWAVSTGGTNYPPGRTNWYTSDYGWDNFRLAVTNLCKRSIRAPKRSSAGYAYRWHSGNNPTDSWDVVKDYCASSGTMSVGSANYKAFGTYLFTDASGYRYAFQYWLRYTNTYSLLVADATNYTPAARGFFLSASYNVVFASQPERYQYDAQTVDYSRSGVWWDAGATNAQHYYGWQTNNVSFSGTNINYESGVWTNTEPLWPTSVPADTNGYVERSVGLHSLLESGNEFPDGVLFLDYSASNGGFRFR